MLKNTIQKWRKRKRVSKAELARAVGRSRSYVTRLERGEIRPSAEALFRISGFFGRPVEDVFQHVADENETAAFVAPEMLPIRQHVTFTPVPARPMCVKPATLPACPAGVKAELDKSLVGPTAKGVACPVARLSHKK